MLLCLPWHGPRSPTEPPPCSSPSHPPPTLLPSPQLLALHRELHTRHSLQCFVQLPVGPAAAPLGALLLAKRTPNCFEDARCAAAQGGGGEGGEEGG
jgi:hypothetical protein